MPEGKQDFQNAGERLLVRKTIEAGLKTGGSVTEIKDMVRSKNLVREKLLSRLTETLVNPDDQFLKLNQYFYDTLSSDFPEIVATGLCGSGALGGVKMRRESGEMEHTDYDSFLIVEPGIEMSTIYDIEKRAEGLLEKLTREGDLLVENLPNNFHFCPEYNYRHYHLTDLGELSTDGIGRYLKQVFMDVSVLESARVLMYFMPTYPPEIGERNQKIFLEFLSSLPPEKWRLWTNGLKDAWIGSISPVKEKHLLSEKVLDWRRNQAEGLPSEHPRNRSEASLLRDIKLADTISGDSSLLSSDIFDELIDSTRPS